MEFQCFALNSTCAKRKGFQHSQLALIEIWRCPQCGLYDPAHDHTASPTSQKAELNTPSPQKPFQFHEPGDSESLPLMIGSSPPISAEDDLTPRASQSLDRPAVHDSPTHLPHRSSPSSIGSRALTVPLSRSTILSQLPSPLRSSLFHSQGTARLERQNSSKRTREIKKESSQYTSQARFNICVDIYVSRSKHHLSDDNARRFRLLKPGMRKYTL
jgi:hypothetical protein